MTRNRPKDDATCPAWMPWVGPDDPFSHEHQCIRPPHRRGAHECRCGAHFAIRRPALEQPRSAES